MTKRRAPIKQLRKAGRMARDLLIKKGFVHTVALDELAKDAGGVILPGVPSYLPHRWTIDASRRIMYDLGVEWMEKNKNNEKRLDQIAEFFTFVVKRMKEEEDKAQAEILDKSSIISQLEDVPVLSEIFAPLRKKQTANALNKFFVDSFAVAIVENMSGSTSDYVDWFLNVWTPGLYNFWTRQEKKDGTNNN
jgi:hypothetical protein